MVFQGNLQSCCLEPYGEAEDIWAETKLVKPWGDHRGWCCLVTQVTLGPGAHGNWAHWFAKSPASLPLPSSCSFSVSWMPGFYFPGLISPTFNLSCWVTNGHETSHLIVASNQVYLSSCFPPRVCHLHGSPFLVPAVTKRDATANEPCGMRPDRLAGEPHILPLPCSVSSHTSQLQGLELQEL